MVAAECNGLLWPWAQTHVVCAGDAILLIVSGMGPMNSPRNQDFLKYSFIKLKVIEMLKALTSEFTRK